MQVKNLDTMSELELLKYFANLLHDFNELDDITNSSSITSELLRVIEYKNKNYPNLF